MCSCEVPASAAGGGVGVVWYGGVGEEEDADVELCVGSWLHTLSCFASPPTVSITFSQ